MDSTTREDDMSLFNEFTSKSELVDLHLHERPFTCSKTGNGVMS